MVGITGYQDFKPISIETLQFSSDLVEKVCEPVYATNQFCIKLGIKPKSFYPIRKKLGLGRKVNGEYLFTGTELNVYELNSEDAKVTKTTTEVANKLNVHPRTIRYHIEQGDFPGTKMIHGKYRIPHAAVIEFISSHFRRNLVFHRK